ncbi:MAG: tetratricopeptide repeat protein [Acidobacteria bacterium]|nr:tetratricopeptide repeat protein [Acidobacteriota bacterium]
MNLSFTYPWMLWPALGLGLLALGLGLWAQFRPGQSVRVVGQSPFRLGLGMSLVLLGLGAGIAGPRWGRPELPRLTVHVVLDASRSMEVRDCGPNSRWEAALARLDDLWSTPQPGLRFAVDLLTGDDVPLLPPGEDRTLLRESLRAITPGSFGSPGTSLGRGLPQVLSQVEARAPAILLLLSDGEESWEEEAAAGSRALGALKAAEVPLYAIAFGGELRQPLPKAATEEGKEALTSAAHPDFLRRLAEGSGGRLLGPREDLGDLLRKLAAGNLPLPVGRSLQPARPEWGAWIARAGFLIWLGAAGKPMVRWRPLLALLALSSGAGLRAELPVPEDLKAWLAQMALSQGRLEEARRWKPRGDLPLHRLVAAKVDLLSGDPAAAVARLEPLIGLGTPRPVPNWRGPALLLAARAQAKMGHVEEARNLLERLLTEVPGRPEAIHNLQTLVKDPSPPPPPNPKKPPPPPPPRPSFGAQQDELEGIKQRLPPPKPQGGIKDL